MYYISLPVDPTGDTFHAFDSTIGNMSRLCRRNTTTERVENHRNTVVA